MNPFKKRKYITLPTYAEIKERQTAIPDGLWGKCPHCQTIHYLPDIKPLKVCVSCGYGYRLTAKERISQIIDEHTFNEIVL